MYALIWVIAIIVFLLLEAATFQYICIWFAGGSLGALVAYALGATLNVQIIVFFVVSAILLILTRPLVKKLMNGRKEKTNIDNIPGKIAKVTQTIDNIGAKGKVMLGAMEWSAVSNDESIIEEGKIVEVLEVKGVKLVVRESEKKEG